MGWLRQVAGTQPSVQLEAVIESTGSGRVGRVDLSTLGRGEMLQLVQLDSRRQEIYRCSLGRRRVRTSRSVLAFWQKHTARSDAPTKDWTYWTSRSLKCIKAKKVFAKRSCIGLGANCCECTIAPTAPKLRPASAPRSKSPASRVRSRWNCGQRLVALGFWRNETNATKRFSPSAYKLR
jgi:hypothetical protein